MNIPETLARKREEAIYLNDLLRSYIEDHEDLTDDQKREFADGEFVRDALIAEGVELEARQSALVEIDRGQTEPGDGALSAPNVIRTWTWSVSWSMLGRTPTP